LGSVPGGVKVDDCFRQHTAFALNERPETAKMRGSGRSHDAELGQVTTKRVDRLRAARTKRPRVRYAIADACCASVLTATNRIVARVAASASSRYPLRRSCVTAGAVSVRERGVILPARSV
jgi:hypothetical protein